MTDYGFKVAHFAMRGRGESWHARERIASGKGLQRRTLPGW